MMSIDTLAMIACVCVCVDSGKKPSRRSWWTPSWNVSLRYLQMVLRYGFIGGDNYFM